MNKPLRILMLEDNCADAELVQYELEDAGFTLTANLVSGKNEFIHALQEFEPDMILSDYDLPQYNGALALADAKRICPEVPFILVTGAVSEDRAIEILTSGAKDYVMKNRISRLVPAVQRVLAETEEHKARKKAEEELRKAYIELEEKIRERTAQLQEEIEHRQQAEEALRANEYNQRERAEELAAILDAISTPVIIAHDSGCTHITGNRAANELLKFTSREEISLTACQERRPQHYKAVKEGRELRLDELPICRAAKGENVQGFEYTLVFDDGTTRELVAYGTPLRDCQGNPRGAVHTLVDITGRKQAEEALRDKEAELKEITDITPVMLNRCSRDLRFVFVNKACCDFFQKTREEIVGKKIVDVLGKPALEKILPYIEKVLQGVAVTYEKEIPYKNAGSKFMYVTYMPEYNKQNEITGWLASVVDITESKKVRQAQEHLSTLIDHSPSLAFLKDESGRYVYVNKAYLEQFNLPPEDWFGKTDFDFWPKESAELFRANDYDVLQSGQTRQFLEDSADLAGNRHCWLCCKFAFTDSGNRSYVGGIGIDVVDRVRTEEALKESEARFKALSEATPNGACISSMDGVLLYTNPAFENIIGYEPGEMTGKKATDIWWNIEDRKAWLNIMKNGGVVRDFQAKLRKKDGTAVWGSMGGAPIIFGNELGVIGTIQDVTNSKEAEENLSLYAAKLEVANKELESFSYSVSHDLQAPLRAIDGYSRIILKKHGDNFDEDTRRQFNQVRKSTKTMGQLIEDLLTLSRSGRQDLIIKSLNIRRIIKKVWEGMQNDNPGRKMTLKINNPFLPGSGDEGLIQQVIVNLLANAVKFTKTRDAALIEAGSYQRNQELVFYVKDNGVGFDMQYHDKLFGTFQRLHSANEYEGTGIGMALVKRIIHRHGGQVWAEGEVDKGATFYFTLPQQNGYE